MTRNHCWNPVALIIILFTELRKTLHAFGIINTTSLCYLLFFWGEGTNCIHFNSRHLKIHSFFFLKRTFRLKSDNIYIQTLKKYLQYFILMKILILTEVSLTQHWAKYLFRIGLKYLLQICATWLLVNTILWLEGQQYLSQVLNFKTAKQWYIQSCLSCAVFL